MRGTIRKRAKKPWFGGEESSWLISLLDHYEFWCFFFEGGVRALYLNYGKADFVNFLIFFQFSMMELQWRKAILKFISKVLLCLGVLE